MWFWETVGRLKGNQIVSPTNRVLSGVLEVDRCGLPRLLVLLSSPVLSCS